MKNISRKLIALCLVGACMSLPIGLYGCGSDNSDDASAAKSDTTSTTKTTTTKTDTTKTDATQTKTGESTAKKAESVTMYTLANLTLRAKGAKDADVVTIIPVGSKVKVTDTTDADWYAVTYDSKEGFASSEYLTKSKKKATKAKEDAEAAEAAESSAGKSSDYDDGSSSSKSSSGKTVVSREKYDDCDGSGHGYEEITYSDGSTEVVEY